MDWIWWMGILVMEHLLLAGLALWLCVYVHRRAYALALQMVKEKAENKKLRQSRERDTTSDPEKAEDEKVKKPRGRPRKKTDGV